MNGRFQTFCRNCVASCGIELEINENRILKVRGDRTHPVTNGYSCVKAQSSADLHMGEEGRLIVSLKRSAHDGPLVPVASDVAIDEIGAKLVELLKRYGPRSIALFRGTASYTNSLGLPMALSWLDAVGTPNHFSSMTIDQAAKWVTVLRMGYFESGARQLSEVDVMLLIGNNPIVSHQTGATTAPIKAFKEAKARGAQFIVIDPRKTETARFAALHLQPIPGEDATICAGLVNLILQNNWEDKDFCSRYVDNVEELRNSVRRFTVDYVANRAQIPGEQLYAAAHMFATADRAAAVGGTGVCMGAHANLADHMIESLNAICGAYRRAGDRVPNGGTLFPRTLIERALAPSRSWETGIKLRSANAGQLFGEFQTALLPDEILTPGSEQIRALIVLGGNPAVAIGQPDKTVAALKSLELLVTIDPRMTKTAALSHYVIAPSLPFERHDVSVVADLLASSSYVQYAAPSLTPPSGVISEVDFFWGLARRMGLPLVFKPMPVGAVYSATPGGHSLDMTTPPHPLKLLQWICEINNLSLEELKAHPGGIQVHATNVRVAEAPEGTGGSHLDVCPPDVASEVRELRAEETATHSFPYRLVVRRMLETLNSAYRSATATRRRYATNPAFMNPEDMTLLGLSPGEAIEIVSKYGRIVGIARPDATLRQAVISMSHGWGSSDPTKDELGLSGGHTGRLVSLEKDLDRITYMPRQTAIPVTIRPLARLTIKSTSGNWRRHDGVSSDVPS